MSSNESQNQVDMTSHWINRLIAAIIDSIPWLVISYILWYVLSIGPLRIGFASISWAIWGLLSPLIYGLIWLIYSVVMESSSSQATFGKKLMGLQVQMTNGSKPTTNKILTRNTSKVLWIVFVIDILLGFATTGPDPRQRYFDRIAGTTVVQIKQAFTTTQTQIPPPPPPPPPPS
jgi:uncharacterized RDD family membrane protein YckC